MKYHWSGVTSCSRELIGTGSLHQIYAYLPSCCHRVPHRSLANNVIKMIVTYCISVGVIINSRDAVLWLLMLLSNILYLLKVFIGMSA